jgi:hypothetical protein
MALTDNCDVFLSVNESALNRLVKHVTTQRPSLFNRGSPAVVANPQLLCSPVTPHPVVFQRGNPVVGPAPDLPVPGTPFLVEYAVQLAVAEIDVHPNDIASLPPELSPLGDQRLALHARVCAGLGCPPERFLESLPSSPLAPVGREKWVSDRKIPIPFRELECFCLDLFATLGVDFTGPAGNQHVVGRLDGLEIVDLEPTGLENAIECYAKLAIRLGLLPQLSVALIRFPQTGSGPVTVEPSVPPAVANNPALEDDQLKLFLDLSFGPLPPPGGGGGGGGTTPPPTFPGSPRARTRTGPFDAQAALAEDAVQGAFTAVRDGFSFDETLSGNFGPFSASVTAAGHLENGTVDLRPDNSIALDELDLEFDTLRACLGINIPEICIGGFCIIPNPLGGCLVRAPRLCAFSDNPDIEFCLDIAAFVRFELSAALRPLMKYSVNPGRTPTMNDWDAFDASVPNHWQLYIDPLTIDLDLFDIADAVGDLLEEALDAALDTILGPLPQWAKDLIKAILGPIINVVRAILDFGDDFVEWLSQLIGVSLGLGNLVLQLLGDYLASQKPVFELPDPVTLLEPQVAPTPLIPVLVPMEFIGVHVTGDELVLEVDIGD